MFSDFRICASVRSWPPGTPILIHLLTFPAHRDVTLYCALSFTRLLCQRVTISQVQTLARKSYLCDKCRDLCVVSLASLATCVVLCVEGACLLPVDWLQYGCWMFQTESLGGTVVGLIGTILSCGELLREAELD
jgi:hypothetical protein